MLQDYLKKIATTSAQGDARIMEDPGHYCKMATALKETIALQSQIDSLFIKVEKTVLP
ncbi:MAG: hypothetical protein ORN54_12565 [Cyclobacteriaceae bacterium]|nr:hypothetical protein [Cyclobacteriaceae bacterium]